MSYAKNLVSATGVTTRQVPRHLPEKRYQHPRNPWLDIKAWRAKWQAIHASDIINKLVFGAYAIALFLFGYIMQEYAKAGPLQYMTLYFPAAGCLWLAINSKKILQTSKNQKKTDVHNDSACDRAGRPESFRYFHPAFPSESPGQERSAEGSTRDR